MRKLCWFALGFVLAVLAMVLANALKTEAQPRYDGAMFVRMEAGWQHV